MNISNVLSALRIPLTDTSTTAGATPGPEVTSLLPEPGGAAQFSDPAVMVAYLMERSSETERNEENDIAQANEQVQYRAESDQIQAMKDEASHTLASGIVSGLTEVGAGVCQFASALATPANASASAADASKPAAAATAPLLRTQGMLKAGATAFSALKDLGTGFYGAAEKQDEVHAKQADQAAQLAGQQATAARTAANDYSDTVNRALDYMKSFLDMQNQTRLAQLQGG